MCKIQQQEQGSFECLQSTWACRNVLAQESSGGLSPLSYPSSTTCSRRAMKVAALPSCCPRPKSPCKGHLYRSTLQHSGGLMKRSCLNISVLLLWWKSKEHSTIVGDNIYIIGLWLASVPWERAMVYTKQSPRRKCHWGQSNCRLWRDASASISCHAM